MSYNFFAYLSRMRYISRWSLMRNALDENIQEHSHQVAVLAHALGVIRRDVFGVDCDPEEYPHRRSAHPDQVPQRRDPRGLPPGGRAGL